MFIARQEQTGKIMSIQTNIEKELEKINLFWCNLTFKSETSGDVIIDVTGEGAVCPFMRKYIEDKMNEFIAPKIAGVKSIKLGTTAVHP